MHWLYQTGNDADIHWTFLHYNLLQVQLLCTAFSPAPPHWRRPCWPVRQQPQSAPAPTQPHKQGNHDNHLHHQQQTVREDDSVCMKQCPARSMQARRPRSGCKPCYTVLHSGFKAWATAHQLQLWLVRTLRHLPWAGVPGSAPAGGAGHRYCCAGRSLRCDTHGDSASRNQTARLACVAHKRALQPKDSMLRGMS
jgi:hypothetical protein